MLFCFGGECIFMKCKIARNTNFVQLRHGKNGEEESPVIADYRAIWRRVRDSNPGFFIREHEISSFAPSTTRTTLHLTYLL